MLDTNNVAVDAVTVGSCVSLRSILENRPQREEVPEEPPCLGIVYEADTGRLLVSDRLSNESDSLRIRACALEEATVAAADLFPRVASEGEERWKR